MSPRHLLLVALVAPAALAAQDQPAKKLEKDAGPKYTFKQNHDPDGIGKFYMGREIAQVMGHQAADWLERPEREREERPSKLLEALRLKDGEVVADVGAGSGYHTFRMAKKVGPSGKVYAVDIQQEMLDIIKQKAKETGLNNVTPVLGNIQDPKLPPAAVDTILLVDVYHEFSHPWEMTRAMAAALKPGGRLVFVEFRGEDSKVPIKRLHKMTRRQLLKEMAPHGLTYRTTLDVLPWQHIVIFERPVTEMDKPTAKAGAAKTD